MHVRLFYVLVIAAGILVGTTGQQLVALAVAGLLVTRRTMIARTGARTGTRLVVPSVAHPEPAPVHR